MNKSNITNLHDNVANQAPSGMKTVLPNITVFGVGGGGCNAVNNMIEKGIEGVRFVSANSDLQSLVNSRADKIIQLGKQTTKGLGSGSRPEIGKVAAEESLDEIIEELKDVNMLFIATGLGGGSGTGATPVIAQAAKDKGILTVAIVTTPFDFEGDGRRQIAETAVKELEEIVDSLVVLPNQNLFEVVGSDTLMKEAFQVADGILVEGVKNITDLMIKQGLINLDFADIRSVMMGKGRAVIGTAIAEGENRAIVAAEEALVNRLLSSNTISGAKGVLVNISGSEDDLSLEEISTAMNRIREDVGLRDSNIIFGTSFDDDLAGKIKVSLVAAGFDGVANFSGTFSSAEVETLEKVVDEGAFVDGISLSDAAKSDIALQKLSEEKRVQAAQAPVKETLFEEETVKASDDLVVPKEISERVVVREAAQEAPKSPIGEFSRLRDKIDGVEIGQNEEDVQLEQEFNTIAENQETAEDIAEEITEEIETKLQESPSVVEEDVFVEIEEDGEVDRVDEVVVETTEDVEDEDKKIGKSKFFTSIFKKGKKEDEAELIEEEVDEVPFEEVDIEEEVVVEEAPVVRTVKKETVVRKPAPAASATASSDDKQLKSDNVVFISSSMKEKGEEKKPFNLMDVIEEMEESLDIPAVFRK
ncbi:MAG: cell division protein FtsZ [Alphaproteobacteria bacterium]|jgi:cell division protein FtsZ|nr:cell division protein FtsZ [Alphaproteobacteria bacterium]